MSSSAKRPHLETPDTTEDEEEVNNAGGDNGGANEDQDVDVIYYDDDDDDDDEEDENEDEVEEGMEQEVRSRLIGKCCEYWQINILLSLLRDCFLISVRY